MPPTREPVPESGLQITSLGDGPFFLATCAGAGGVAGAGDCAAGAESADGVAGCASGAAGVAGSAKTAPPAVKARADARLATINFDKRHLFKGRTSQAPCASPINPRLLAKIYWLTTQRIAAPGGAPGQAAYGKPEAGDRRDWLAYRTWRPAQIAEV